MTRRTMMSRVGESIRQEQEQQIEQNEMDMAWQQKQLEDEQLIEIAKNKNMFEWQAIQDAIYYSKRLRAVEDK
jgi:Skp family chaperone for outer membrane proteins